MRIVGYERASLVDWPGRVAAVLFLPGCNLDCFYCHNRRLLGEQANQPLGFQPLRRRLNRRVILDELRRRADRLDGVVITGGEPTLQPGLVSLIDAIRRLGLPVKLDTNGSNPGLIERLLDNRRLAAAAIDIKAPPDRYDEIAGPGVNPDRIHRTFRAVHESGIDYELRTTCIPQLGLDDVEAMATWIAGARSWVLQQYRPLPPDLAWLDARHFVPPHPPEWFAEARDLAGPWVESIGIRGVDLTPLTTSARPAPASISARHTLPA